VPIDLLGPLTVAQCRTMAGHWADRVDAEVVVSIHVAIRGGSKIIDVRRSSVEPAINGWKNFSVT
jgi:hypothetical protein